jgi:hypothetical protein|eukprot:6054703-Prymnesium_polylepis.1
MYLYTQCDKSDENKSQLFSVFALPRGQAGHDGRRGPRPSMLCKCCLRHSQQPLHLCRFLVTRALLLCRHWLYVLPGLLAQWVLQYTGGWLGSIGSVLFLELPQSASVFRPSKFEVFYVCFGPKHTENIGDARCVGRCGDSGTTPASGGERRRVGLRGVRVGRPWGVQHVTSLKTSLRNVIMFYIPMVSDILFYSYNERDLLRLTFLTSRRRRRIANLLNAHGRRGRWIEHDYRNRKLR